MNTKKIGKITSVKFGTGGYQDAMFGLSLGFGSSKDRWSVGDFKGSWSLDIKADKFCRWTEKDRSRQLDEMVRFCADIIHQAKVSDIMDLKGVPVEVTFDGNCGSPALVSWRILTEVL